MKNPTELANFTKYHRLDFNTKKDKAVEAFTRLVANYPKISFTFAFLGFHNYQSFRTHEGLTAYGISGTTLYAVSRRKAYRYNLYRCQDFDISTKLNGKKLTFLCENEPIVIDLGFCDAKKVLTALKSAKKS